MAAKTIGEVYRQRTEAFMLAMAFGKKLGYEVGVRGDAEWPVLVIVLEDGKEVAIHAHADDIVPQLIDHRTDRRYDNHTEKDREVRIRDCVSKVFEE